MKLFLDGKKASFPKGRDWANFEEFCDLCAASILPEKRVLQAVRMDGKEVDCNAPPLKSDFSDAGRVDLDSCSIEDLALSALQQQQEIASALAEEALELSSDCLIKLPREVLEPWRSILESLKPLVGFIPRFIWVEAQAGLPQPEFSEEILTARIKEIQDIVDAARRSLEALDIVLFSDTLELRMVPWLNAHKKILERLYQLLQTCDQSSTAAKR